MKLRNSLFILVFSMILLGICFNAKAGEIASTTEEQDFSRLAGLYNKGEFSKAIKGYKQLADEGNLVGYLNLAVIFEDLGDYSRAIYVLKRARGKFADDVRILSLLGKLYYLNNQTVKAIVAMNKVLELKPNDVDAFITLGLCYDGKGDDNTAQQYFSQAVSLDKNNFIARFSQAGLYYRNDRFSEALDEYKAASFIDASIISIQKMLGELFFRLGKFEEANRRYQRLILIVPQDKLVAQRLNEISLKLGKEFFEQEKSGKKLLRKEKSVLVKPFPRIKNAVIARVGILQSRNSLEFKCSSPFVVKTRDGKFDVLNGSADKNYLVIKNSDGRLVISEEQNADAVVVDETILINPSNPRGTITIFNVQSGMNNFWSNQEDRSYRGSVEITNGINVVNIVNLEEYLYGVVPSEMPASWPKEALKAQAVAARSEAFKKLGRHKNEGFDFCAEVHCQSYKGIEKETQRTNEVVDETRGEVMLYKGKLVDAVYSSNCGGHTQNNVFGNTQDIPYLAARIDSFDGVNLTFPLSPFEMQGWLREPPKEILCSLSGETSKSNFRWIRIYSAQELNEALNKIADFGVITKIIVLKRQPSGHISAIKVIGTKAAQVLEKELNIRQALGNLRSSMFKVEIQYGPDKKPKTFIFYGGGWGHGVGMCQSGAYGMAKQGNNQKDILKHYFQAVEFKKIY